MGLSKNYGPLLGGFLTYDKNHSVVDWGSV